jgi:hypothetical protein
MILCTGCVRLDFVYGVCSEACTYTPCTLSLTHTHTRQVLQGRLAGKEAARDRGAVLALAAAPAYALHKSITSKSPPAANMPAEASSVPAGGGQRRERAVALGDAAVPWSMAGGDAVVSSPSRMQRERESWRERERERERDAVRMEKEVQARCGDGDALAREALCVGEVGEDEGRDTTGTEEGVQERLEGGVHEEQRGRECGSAGAATEEEGQAALACVTPRDYGAAHGDKMTGIEELQRAEERVEGVGTEDVENVEGMECMDKEDVEDVGTDGVVGGTKRVGSDTGSPEGIRREYSAVMAEMVQHRNTIKVRGFLCACRSVCVT